MSERNKRPGLSSRPPGPRDLDDFLEGADKPRGEREPVAASPAGKIPANNPPARKAGGAPWEAPGFNATATVAFKARMQARHHAMLQWLAAVTPRKSMNDWLLDLAEPAIEEAVKRKREELGR